MERPIQLRGKTNVAPSSTRRMASDSPGIAEVVHDGATDLMKLKIINALLDGGLWKGISRLGNPAAEKARRRSAQNPFPKILPGNRLPRDNH